MVVGRWLSIPLAAVFLLAAAPPAWADRWYEHYARAEQALADEDPETAVVELNLALERRGDSGVRVRTYGMRVIDYFPYLKLGIAYHLAGEHDAALRAFDTEERLGAIKESIRASDELARYRRSATDALERRRADRQRVIDNLVDQNLAEARRLQGMGRLDEALAAVDRALAVAPENSDAGDLAGVLRQELARRKAETTRQKRVAELIAEGDRLGAESELSAAAARYRQAFELAPASRAGELLQRVQTEIARQRSADPSGDSAQQLERAEAFFDSGELETALGLVQQVIAAAPDNADAVDLERRILARISELSRTAGIALLLADAERRLADGDSEGAIAAANLVLAEERGNPEALELIQHAYGVLSRRLLGEGPVQNLPPAIRFADMRQERADGALVQVVPEPSYRLSGVVIDDSTVILSAAAGDGLPVTTEQSSQVIGGVAITEFRLEAQLPVGATTFEVVATDAGGLSSRSGYAVEYRRPLVRSPWLWGAVIAFGLLVVAVLVTRRALRRRRLLRRRFNPYVAGPPVLDPELFVGREDLLDRVLATVPNNSLLLLGERRIGKTSLLYQLRLRLVELDHPRFCFVPVPIDLQGVPEDSFFASVAEAVGETIGDERMALARIEDGYDSRELTSDLRRVLPTLECAEGKRAKVVLLLDEIDELNGYSHRTNQRLRSLFMRGFADQVVAVAAGVGIARQWDHEGSPWYNFFEELEVGPVDDEAAKRLVTEPLSGVLTFDDEAVARLIEEAAGRPYLVQKIALAVVQRVHEESRSRITVADVESVV